MNTAATAQKHVYIPRLGSLADRVLAYFNQEPFEELSQADVATKFEVSRGSVSSSLKQAVDSGKLAYAQNDDLEYVYTLGVNTAARPAAARPQDAANEPKTPPAATTSSPTEKAPGNRPNSRHKVVVRVTEADMAALKVEVGVPIETGKGPSGVSKWQAIFDKLTAPDTSLAFPIAWKSAVAADASKRNQNAKKRGEKSPFYRVAIVSETQARIWRVA